MSPTSVNKGKAGTRRRTPPLSRLSERDRLARERALNALRLMRRDGLTLERAAREAHTKPSTVKRWASGGLDRPGRRWQAKPNDRITRRQMTRIIGPDGELLHAVVETRSFRQSSVIGQHNADVQIYLSVRTDPTRRQEVRSRIEARHGKRAGLRAFLPDGSTIKDPQFFGIPEDIRDQSDIVELGDIDYGSSASVRSTR